MSEPITRAEFRDFLIHKERLESGKRLRQKLGLETIPPRVEYEIAAGQYLRLVAASPYARKDEP